MPRSASLIRGSQSRAISPPALQAQRHLQRVAGGSCEVAHAVVDRRGRRGVARVHVGACTTIVVVPAARRRGPCGPTSSTSAGPSSMPGRRWQWRSITRPRVAPGVGAARRRADAAAGRALWLSSARGISSVGRAPGSHPGGQRFESAILHLGSKAPFGRAFLVRGRAAPGAAAGAPATRTGARRASAAWPSGWRRRRPARTRGGRSGAGATAPARRARGRPRRAAR